jgi:ribonuclease VapC
MVVDSSALIAIVLEEPDRNEFLELVNEAADPVISVANYVEVAIVLLAKEREDVVADLDELFDTLGIFVHAVTEEHARLAARAYARYGKGRHPAALNFGDCFAYALAKTLDTPLLFKGTDFGRTDIQTAAVRRA